MIKDTRMNDIHLTIAIEWKAYQMIVVILVCGKHFNNIANIDFDELDKDDILSGILMYGYGQINTLFWCYSMFNCKMWGSNLYGVINGSNVFPNNTNTNRLNSLIATSITILTSSRRDKDTPIIIEASILFFFCIIIY